MRAFDHDYVNELVARLGKLRPDAKPAWGAMSAPEMLGHLMLALRYSMGKGPKLPFVGNWATKRLLAPLILHGVLPIPKNVKLPRMESPLPQADLETLHMTLEEYLSRVHTGDLEPPHHPMFGDIGVDGWAKMHVRHFEHHLKQFGL